MKNIFITGGAGYVGAVLVPHLLEKGFTITVLDLMIYGGDVLASHSKLNAVKGDIRDQTLLKKHRITERECRPGMAMGIGIAKETLGRPCIG